MTKSEKFLDLAKPNSEGKTSWIDVTEFVGEYEDLAFGNGASWARKESKLAKEFIIEFDKTKKTGNRIDRIRLNGFNIQDIGNQNIKHSIIKHYKSQRCVLLFTSGKSGKPIEIDHKNGRKNDPRVMNIKTQKLNDFQPLSKAANDAKRQICKDCKRNNIRFDAKKIGYPISYYYGADKHNGSPNGCIGCFWYDPIDFRKHLNQ
jgi:hypothetical protein|tara:strand:+ start:57 stop:668 length:612 start_codon:yes stop_codon:yes gene_type:complete